MNEPPVSIQVQRGGLYLSAALCERFFPGLESVILLRRDEDLIVLPVRLAAAGGYLLKRRNGAGDRVVFAPDFFRAHGIDDSFVCDFPAGWNTEQAALVAKNAFAVTRLFNP